MLRRPPYRFLVFPSEVPLGARHLTLTPAQADSTALDSAPPLP